MFLVLFCSPLAYVNLKAPSLDFFHGFNTLLNILIDLYMESVANSDTAGNFKV